MHAIYEAYIYTVKRRPYGRDMGDRTILYLLGWIEQKIAINWAERERKKERKVRLLLIKVVMKNAELIGARISRGAWVSEIGQ